MKKLIALLVSMILVFSLAACGNKPSQSSQNEPSVEPVSKEEESGGELSSASQLEDTESSAGTEQAESEQNLTEDGQEEIGASGQGNHILIAYFSVPEDVDTSGVDVIAGASVVVKDGITMGNTEYVAQVIQETIGGDLFRIETVQEYPLDHDPLVDQAAVEQDEDARPELATHIENPEAYDTIILGYPNWWADLPQPLYTFLEEYNFEGKTIIPFVTHGGSGFSNTVNTISRLQPGALVSDNTLSLSRNSVAGSSDEVIAWAESLGLGGAS